MLTDKPKSIEKTKLDNKMSDNKTNLLVLGMKEFTMKNYDQASELLADAIELFVDCYGDMAIECADPLYYYGIALYNVALKKNQILSESAPVPSTIEQRKLYATRHVI